MGGQKVSPESQRRAIAEKCGFKPGTFITETHWFDDCVSDGQEEVLFAEHVTNGPKVRVPRYLEDLNAMHEAEKVLRPMQRGQYRTELVYVLAGADIFATAEQRAEAFLRAIGKWEDDK